jgi:hypothetical protein
VHTCLGAADQARHSDADRHAQGPCDRQRRTAYPALRKPMNSVDGRNTGTVPAVACYLFRVILPADVPGELVTRRMVLAREGRVKKTSMDVSRSR